MSGVPVEVIDDIRYLGGIFQSVENDFTSLDYQSTLEGFRERIVSEQSSHFSERRDSSGSIWPPLAAYTIKKKGHDVPLVETGEMKKSVLERGHGNHIEEYSHRGLIFGTDDEKGIFHQFGTRRIPQRAFIGVSEKLVDDFVDEIADHAIESLKSRA